MKKISILAACAALMAVAASCSTTENETPGSEEKRYLELSDPADASIVLNDEDSESFKIGIKTNLKKDEITISEKDGKTWCDASVNETADSIKVIPGSNFTEEDITATFIVRATEGNDVTPFEFTVTRRGTSTEYTVSIKSAQITDGGYPGIYLYNPATEKAEDLTVTVNTNAARWYLNDMNQVTDDEGNPIQWYTIDKKSGRDGENVTISFSDNKTTADRMASLMFVYEQDGFEGPSITVTQKASPATFMKVSVEGKPVEGKEYSVNFTGEVSELSFEMETDGSLDYRWCKPGTVETDASAEDWVTVGNFGGWSISHWSEENAASDLVFFPAGKDTELFRFKVNVTI